MAGGGAAALWSERSLGHTIAEMLKGVVVRMTVTIALLRDASLSFCSTHSHNCLFSHGSPDTLIDVPYVLKTTRLR